MGLSEMPEYYVLQSMESGELNMAGGEGQQARKSSQNHSTRKLVLEGMENADISYEH